MQTEPPICQSRKSVEVRSGEGDWHLVGAVLAVQGGEHAVRPLVSHFVEAAVPAAKKGNAVVV